jgi:mono/diheme cytochrome c family protein
MMNTRIFVLFGLLFASDPGAFAIDEDDEPQRGIVAEYSTANAVFSSLQTRVLVDDQTVASDPRIVDGQPLTVRWDGMILIRDAAPVTFHADVSGELQIDIDGVIVLQSDSAMRRFASGNTVSLAPGDHEIAVTYTSGEQSRLNLFWSSDVFTLEPIPTDVYFLAERQPTLLELEYGRLLTDAMRCSGCHSGLANTKPSAAPSLERLTGSQSLTTLVARLQDPSRVVRNSHMPNFGLSTDQAKDISAFLLDVSMKPHDEQQITFKEGDQSAGRLLLNSVGCVACHAIPDVDADAVSLSAPFDAPELQTLHRRRTIAWVDRWLRDPKSLNQQHRMPEFALSKDERRQIIAALFATEASETSLRAPQPERIPQRIAAGKTLVMDLNCAACHQVPGIEAKPVRQLSRDAAAGDSPRASGDKVEQSCIHGTRSAVKTGRPWYTLTDEQRAGLTAWLHASKRSGDTVTGLASGKLLLRRNGCLACHDRDRNRGLSAVAATLEKTHPGLKGMSQGLIPPALTAIGDKLNVEFLSTAVAGDQKNRRLPWLNVRMPKFSHSKHDREELVRYLVAVDRIPDAADGVRQDILTGTDVDNPPGATDAELLMANQLTGAGGFNCVACHSAGTFEPRNVALGTRGSDIMKMGSQLRTRFFLRWMKNPIRVVPGIEMPAIRKPAQGVLNDSLPDQITLIWRALQDERFTPPTVTSRFEQFLTVHQDDPPRIVRDVFTVGQGKEQTAVPRAMAIGFNSGHSILIDLDTLQFMQWTFGGFARQRTEGKSWYWDMAGVTVATESPEGPRILARAADGTEYEPVIDEARICELVSYELLNGRIEFTVRFHMKPTGAPSPVIPTAPHADYSAWHDPAAPTVPLEVRYSLGATSDDAAQHGWNVSVTLARVESGLQLELANLVSLIDNSGHAAIHWRGPLTETDACVLGLGDSAFAEGTLPTTRILAEQLPQATIINDADHVTSTPGYDGTRLPLDASIMPTSIAILPDGRLAFTSLKGHVWKASDVDGDGLHDQLDLFEEGLASPFGILPDGNALLVAHKPELLSLVDSDDDGRADQREVVASGWGYSDNYHDWTTGLIRDREGNLFLGLGSDYSDRKRSRDRDRWRGGIVKVNTAGHVSPVAMAFRYPLGLALDSAGRLYATDNQGVQNTFNEINVIEQDGRYGVPSTFDTADASDHEIPAIGVPHPWARSVNSILFLPDDYPVESLRGHGIGCEYDNRFLIRFTTQEVNGRIQGATYRFSLPNQPGGDSNFIGPICSALGKDGAIYIGSIWDSGWQGGINTGGITKLMPSSTGMPNGMREVRATKHGFEIAFFDRISVDAVGSVDDWSIHSFTRKWSGQYASPDSDERSVRPNDVSVSDDGLTVVLSVPDLKSAHMYDISVRNSADSESTFWPAEAHYWMSSVPE